MKRILVRYRTKTDRIDENKRLIQSVFRELQTKSPAGIRYVALGLGDGNFVHLVETADGANPLPELEAFRIFQNGIRERCLEPPQADDVTFVGNFRMLHD